MVGTSILGSCCMAIEYGYSIDDIDAPEKDRDGPTKTMTIPVGWKTYAYLDHDHCG